jgi:hypothetical protein
VVRLLDNIHAANASSATMRMIQIAVATVDSLLDEIVA